MIWKNAITSTWILCDLEELSGLKINFYKSDLFCFRETKEAEAEYATIFGWERGSLYRDIGSL